MAKLCDHGYFLEVAPRSCPKCRTDLDLIQREEIAALKSTISRLTSERDAAELFSLALKDKCGSTISRLREYVGHKPDC